MSGAPVNVGSSAFGDFFQNALEEFGLLVFRNQNLTPQQLVDLVKLAPDVDDSSAELNPFAPAESDRSCLPELPVVRALGNISPQGSAAVPEDNQMGGSRRLCQCDECSWYHSGLPGVV